MAKEWNIPSNWMDYSNKSYVLEAIAIVDGRLLQYASAALKRDKEVVLTDYATQRLLVD